MLQIGCIYEPFRELLLGGVSVGGKFCGFTRSFEFLRITIQLRVNRLARWCSLVTRERLRLNKRMFFLESFNGDLVAREFDRHWSQHERSFNLHRSIWLIFEIQSPKTSIIPSKTECRPAGWRSFDTVRTLIHIRCNRHWYHTCILQSVTWKFYRWVTTWSLQNLYKPEASYNIFNKRLNTSTNGSRAPSFSSYKISLFCTIVSISSCNRYHYLPKLYSDFVNDSYSVLQVTLIDSNPNYSFSIIGIILTIDKLILQTLYHLATC